MTLVSEDTHEDSEDDEDEAQDQEGEEGDEDGECCSAFESNFSCSSHHEKYIVSVSSFCICA